MAKKTPTADELRIDWLLSWLPRDLETLRPGALLDTRDEVFEHLHEATLATVTDHDDPDLRALRNLTPFRASNAQAVKEAQSVVVLARDLLARVQADLRAGVEALHQTGSWHPFGLTRDRPGPLWSLERRADGVVVRAWCGNWRTVTVAAAADLLVSWWSRLRRCKYAKCGQLFRPSDKRQVFHDAKCGKLVYWHARPTAPATRDYVQESLNAARRDLKKKKTQKKGKRR